MKRIVEALPRGAEHPALGCGLWAPEPDEYRQHLCFT
jgi:hypothetical protein